MHSWDHAGHKRDEHCFQRVLWTEGLKNRWRRASRDIERTGPGPVGAERSPALSQMGPATVNRHN
jgi:hypothetical protein